MITRTDLLRALYNYFLYLIRLKDPSDLIENMVAWARGFTDQGMKELCAATYSELLQPSLFREAVQEINRHRQNGGRVIILSSTLNYICEAFSVQLGMDGYISSSLELKDGYFTGKPVGRICYGSEKLTRMTGYCSDNNLNHSDSWYYSDSISDLPVLDSVGHPVCVNPDRKLRTVAKKRSWQIFDWDN